ncbi:MAG: response regulator [Candidatus Thermoplasmatota archaeon]
MATPRDQRVLVVDDEPDILDTVRACLEADLGVEVREARSGPQALALVESTAFDLILTDYKMPGMDGLELLRHVAARAPSVPRVLMTAFPDVDLAINALNDGRILHFLSKPLAPEELRDVLGAILDEHRARKQRESALRRSLEQLRRHKP